MQCVVCHSTNIELATTIPRVPVLCNILWPTRDEALAVPKVDVGLAFCHSCGHLFNPEFDPSLMVYSQDYENSLHFSSRFQSYARSLASDLVDRHQLHNKNVLEIGCGQGDFLKLLCSLGNNSGVGFDKSYVPDAAPSQTSVKIIRDWYSEQYALFPVDFICCRHVLEHIEEPFDFLSQLRQILGERHHVVTFFEVPNALFTLRDLAIWDIIYEHCSYYSRYSLEALFVRTGFEVIDLYETYEGQFLCIEAKPAGKAAKRVLDPAELITDVRSFDQRYKAKTAAEQAAVDRLKERGKRAVVWGAGSKGITFLNMLQLQDQIDFVVDINPRKEGKFVTGTGQKIVPPAQLAAYDPDVIIVMNPVYIDEIQKMTIKLGVDSEFMLV